MDAAESGSDFSKVIAVLDRIFQVLVLESVLKKRRQLIECGTNYLMQQYRNNCELVNVEYCKDRRKKSERLYWFVPEFWKIFRVKLNNSLNLKRSCQIFVHYSPKLIETIKVAQLLSTLDQLRIVIDADPFNKTGVRLTLSQIDHIAHNIRAEIIDETTCNLVAIVKIKTVNALCAFEHFAFEWNRKIWAEFQENFIRFLSDYRHLGSASAVSSLLQNHYNFCKLARKSSNFDNSDDALFVRCLENGDRFSVEDFFARIKNLYEIADTMGCSVNEINAPDAGKLAQIIIKLLHLNKYELCVACIGISDSTLIEALHSDNNLKLSIIEEFDQNVLYPERQLEIIKIIIILPGFDELLDEFFPALIDENAMQIIVDHFMSKKKPLDIKISKQIIAFNIFTRLRDNLTTFWTVNTSPFLVLETLLMNQQIEDLTTIVTAIRPFLLKSMCQSCSKYVYFTDLANLDQDHQHMPYTESCLNKLITFYGTHSIDIQVVDSIATSDMCVERKELGFYLPVNPPLKHQWTRPDTVSWCMCCKLTKFTMTKRRHSCRRCGRVVCHNCLKRMKIAGMYKNVPVKTCDECIKWAGVFPVIDKAAICEKNRNLELKRREITVWSLSGNESEDTEIRLQFGYADSPSVALCLAIMALHTNDQDCRDFFWKQCKKTENFLRPLRFGVLNPEIDYGLMAKMLRCLAVGGKMKGGDRLFDEMIVKADIIGNVVEMGHEKLLPIEKLNTSESLRKLRDNLLQAEIYGLALDISLKCGFPITGVMQAWGFSLIKVDNPYLARDKLGHCVAKIVPENVALRFADQIVEKDQFEDHPVVLVRPKVSPNVLKHILTLIEDKYDVDWEMECLYYLFLSGSHEDILTFLVKCKRIAIAFRYILNQNLDFDCFLNAVVLNPFTEINEVEIVKEMGAVDGTFVKWEPYIQRLCLLYEKKNVLVCLYNLQAALGDDIRAAMTCVKFFSNNCSNYRSFLGHLDYLEQAKYHLNLELKKYEGFGKISTSSAIRMKLNSTRIYFHLNVIDLQMKVTKFLANYEDQSNLLDVVSRCSGNLIESPLTVFDNQFLKYLIYLIAQCDATKSYSLIKQIFIVFPTINQDLINKFVLESFAREGDLDKILQYVQVVQEQTLVPVQFDQHILSAVEIISHLESINRAILEKVINLIANIHTRINAFIVGEHLKSAYLLAVEHKAVKLMTRIAKQAEFKQHLMIKRLCDKHLAKSVAINLSSI